MLRDESVSAAKFSEKFISLKKVFDSKEAIRLDSEYHQEMKSYIERLYRDTISDPLITDKAFDSIREAEMSNLNRLQKMKNKTSYKKDKHKSRSKNEDWG